MTNETRNIIQRFASAIKSSGLSYAALEKKTGYKRSTLQRYATGQTVKIPMNCIEAIAKATDVSTAWIMGWETPDSEMLPSNRFHMAPLLGVIHCGDPVLCDENIDRYITIPSGIRCDYALTCKGDSMIDAGINDGDIVYVQQQPDAENGQIVVAMVGDETTLKRFYRYGDSVTLMPANTKYAPIMLSGEALSSLRILGRAVGFTRWI